MTQRNATQRDATRRDAEATPSLRRRCLAAAGAPAPPFGIPELRQVRSDWSCPPSLSFPTNPPSLAMCLTTETEQEPAAEATATHNQDSPPSQRLGIQASPLPSVVGCLRFSAPPTTPQSTTTAPSHGCRPPSSSDRSPMLFQLDTGRPG